MKKLGKKKGTEKLNLKKINSIMVNQLWIGDFPPPIACCIEKLMGFEHK